MPDTVPPVDPDAEPADVVDAVRFYLHRREDVTGASGTGRVADGIVFPDGTTVVRWRGDRRSTVVWADMADALAVHGHDGRTVPVYID